MIIGITGYGATGASALIALLKEFAQVQFYPNNFEFQLLQQPDGIFDLEYDLIETRRRVSASVSIHRFLKASTFYRSNGTINALTNKQYRLLTKEYVNNLIDIRWKGKSIYDPKDVLGPLENSFFRIPNAFLRRIIKFFNPIKTWPPRKKRYFSTLSKAEFETLTRDYLKKIFISSGFDLNRPIVLEQLFCLESPLKGKEFFDVEVKSIIVDRDPRDVFLLSNIYLAEMCTFMPNTGNVYDFIKYYRALHQTEYKDKNVLYIHFEDLIYNYENTIKTIELFLNLKHVNGRQFFHPEWSISNTQLFLKDDKYSKEIKIIENELSDYLYHFEKASSVFSKDEDVGMFNENPGDKNKILKKHKHK